MAQQYAIRDFKNLQRFLPNKRLKDFFFSWKKVPRTPKQTASSHTLNPPRTVAETSSLYLYPPPHPPLPHTPGSRPLYPLPSSLPSPPALSLVVVMQRECLRLSFQLCSSPVTPCPRSHVFFFFFSPYLRLFIYFPFLQSRRGGGAVLSCGSSVVLFVLS